MAGRIPLVMMMRSCTGSKGKDLRSPKGLIETCGGS
jgi:hypothetical protein